jgi:hypothetical protein
MDPDTCLINILTFLSSPGKPGKGVNRDATAYALEDLADWIRNGGFYPTVHEGRTSFTVNKEN